MKEWICYLTKELSTPFAILISSLLAIFSVLYVSNMEAFYKSNEVLIIYFEISSASFAFSIYILDRMGILIKAPETIKKITNCITVMFFLVTIPHLLADSIEKLSPHRTALIFSLSFPILIVFFSCWFLLKETLDYNFKKSLLYSFLIIISISAILYTLLPMVYGSIN